MQGPLILPNRLPIYDEPCLPWRPLHRLNSFNPLSTQDARRANKEASAAASSQQPSQGGAGAGGFGVGGGVGDPPASERIQCALRGLSASFADFDRALDTAKAFHLSVKDGHVFRALGVLVAPGTNAAEAAEARAEAMRRMVRRVEGGRKGGGAAAWVR